MKSIQKCILLLLVLSLLAGLSGCGRRKMSAATEAWLFSDSPGTVSQQGTASAAVPAATPVVWTPAPTTAPTPFIAPTPSPFPTYSPMPTQEPVPTPSTQEIATTMNKQGWVNGNDVNFREQPGTSADIIRGYDRGKELTILGISNGWTKVLIDGRVGYIKSEYVSDVYVAPDNAGLAGNEISVYNDSTVIAGNSTNNFYAIQSRIIQLTNEQRTTNGLPALAPDARLQTVADTRAAEQAISFSHTRPDGSDWSTAFPAGIFYFLGENLASCDTILTDESFASSCVKWWMESDDHRANILNSLYTSIAVGVCISGNNMYAVQVFGTPY